MGDRELVAAAVMSSFGRTLAAALVAAGLFGYIYFVETKKDPKASKAGEDAPKREKVFTGLDKTKVKSLSLKKPRRGNDPRGENRRGVGACLTS